MLRRHTIENIREMLMDRGVVLLSDEYINNRTKLRVRGRCGHKWWAAFQELNKGTGLCGRCVIKRNGKRRRIGIYMMHEIAMLRGGYCLSGVYRDIYTSLIWQCRYGHVWMARPNGVKNNGNWCLRCSYDKRHTKLRHDIEYVRSKLSELGLTLLSKEYKNNRTPIHVRCSKGHDWWAGLSALKGGSGCLVCSDKRKTVEVEGFLNNHGGELLSEYKNNQTPIHVRCSEGHDWWATFNNVKQGTWCPRCQHLRQGDSQRHSQEYVSKVISDRGGELLSEYKNGQTPIHVRCSEGHDWWPRFRDINNHGTWCPECFRHGILRREPMVREILRGIYGQPFPSVWMSDVVNDRTGHRLQVDCLNRGIEIAVEVHGRQHYEWVDYYHKTCEDFLNLQYRDRLTEAGCRRLGYAFIIVPYWIKDVDLEKFLIDELTKAGVDVPVKKLDDFAEKVEA